MQKFHPHRQWKAEHQYKDVKCAVEGCDIQAKAKGYCHRHYNNFLRCGDPVGSTPIYGPTCTVDGCYQLHHKSGLCAFHYGRKIAFGDPLHIPKVESNRKAVITRNKACEILYEVGYTLSSIGALFGISRERVRQVIQMERESGADDCLQQGDVVE